MIQRASLGHLLLLPLTPPGELALLLVLWLWVAWELLLLPPTRLELLLPSLLAQLQPLPGLLRPVPQHPSPPRSAAPQHTLPPHCTGRYLCFGGRQSEGGWPWQQQQ